jgi:uncharacterized protein YggE
VIAFAISTIGSTSHGQDAAVGPSISVTGKATVIATPQSMRLKIRLLEKGKTIEDVLAKITDRQAAAAIQLAKLGAVEESIEFGKPEKFVDQTQNPEVMDMIRLQFEQQGRKVPAGLNADPGITLTMDVSARWTLPKGKPAIRLGFVHELQTRIEESDIAGIKEPKQLTAEEKELAEELAGFQRNMGGYGAQGTKDPRIASFDYFAEPDTESRKAAFAKAVKQARDDAEILAEAAETKIGAMLHLSGKLTKANDLSSRYGYDPYGMGEEPSTDQWISSKFADVSYTAVVEVRYAISR